MHGEPLRLEGEGLMARCLQHEVDHLDGMVFLDRLTGDARQAAFRALRALSPARAVRPRSRRRCRTPPSGDRTSANPCSAATRRAHRSTGGSVTSTARPHSRHTRWWWCTGEQRR